MGLLDESEAPLIPTATVAAFAVAPPDVTIEEVDDVNPHMIMLGAAAPAFAAAIRRGLPDRS
jgi:hypothetical protein